MGGKAVSVKLTALLNPEPIAAKFPQVAARLPLLAGAAKAPKMRSEEAINARDNENMFKS